MLQDRSQRILSKINVLLPEATRTRPSGACSDSAQIVGYIVGRRLLLSLRPSTFEMRSWLPNEVVAKVEEDLRYRPWKPLAKRGTSSAISCPIRRPSHERQTDYLE